MTKFFAGLAAAVVLAAPTFAVAGGEGKKLSRADFEACNQQAMMIAGVETGVSPAASPATERPGAERERATTPGTTEAPAASPGTTGTDTGTTGTGPGAGVTGTTGTGTSATGTGAGTTSPSAGVSGAGAGAAGTGVTAGVGTGQDADLDKVVDAYRDCLQARK